MTLDEPTPPDPEMFIDTAPMEVAPSETPSVQAEVADISAAADNSGDAESFESGENPAAQAPHFNLRAEMLARFEQWLDQTLAGEPPPRGVPEHLLAEATAVAAGQQPPAEQTDFYTLFSSLTALTGEIRLQGRTFKQLADLLSPLADAPVMLARLQDSVQKGLDSMQAAEEDAQAEGPDISFDRVCEIMIDLYDRLQRGLQTCDEGIQSIAGRAKTGWFHRMLGTSAVTEQAITSVQAIRNAGGLTLGRLQAAMQEWGVQRVGQTGEPFDPERMTAVDVRAVNDVAPGTVLAVQRSGYAVNGILKATAQVTVSKQTT